MTTPTPNSCIVTKWYIIRYQQTTICLLYLKERKIPQILRRGVEV